MNEEEQLRKDILFQIDMQLYDEFNDKFCEMNDNLGTIYTYKDIDDLIKLEKETEIKLLRKAIEKQQKEIEELKHDNSILCEIAYTGKRIQLPYTMVYTGTDNFISKDEIKELKEFVHKTLDDNGITRGYQLTIDNYFKKLLEEENK